MSDLACQNELVLRQRRGELSGPEQSALAAHLGACEACRLGRRLGRDFDESATLESGDGERIAALAALARRWANNAAAVPGAVPPPAPQVEVALGRSRRRFRPRALLLAAALPLFVAAAASAAYGVYRAQTAAPAPAPSVAAPAPTATTHAKRAPRPVSPEAPPVAAAPMVPEPVAAVAVERPRVNVAPARTTDSAAERFELANGARRSGDITRAISLYRELERDFPASAEAAASELRLGNLLLDRGKSGAALEQFDRHLRRAGALAAEALYGRGRALAALDEAAAERQTWTRMLREFSGSPYAAHARRRLETLGAD